MKNLFMFIALSVLLFTSCDCDKDFVPKKKYEELVQENANLKALLAGGDRKQMEPIPDADLVKRVDSLEVVHDIKIPVSLTFEREYLYAMLNTVDNKDSAKGLLGYPIYENGYLKIALVPYFKDNAGKIKHLDKNFGAHNYSDICPSSQINTCAINAANLGAGMVTYDFHK